MKSIAHHTFAALMLSVFLTFALCSSTVSGQRAGTLDISFGVNGIATINTVSWSYAPETYLQPDDKIRFGYYDYDSDVYKDARINANGTIDNTFANCSGSAGNSLLTTYLPDGKKLEIDRNSNNTAFIVRRFTSQCDLDPSFGNAGIALKNFGVPSSGNGLLVQSDQKIVVFGISGQKVTFVRFTADGQFDTGFGSFDGILQLEHTSIYNAILQKNDKILFSSYDSANKIRYVSRLDRDGSVDIPFGNSGAITTTRPLSIAIQPDGKILLIAQDSQGFVVVRYLQNGQRDFNFAVDGAIRFPSSTDTMYWPATVVHVQPNGKFIVAGSTRTSFVFSRYTQNGFLDLNFGVDGAASTTLLYPYLSNIHVQNNRKLVAVGLVNAPYSASPIAARYLTDNISLGAPYDFDGDGRADPAVVRTPSWTWYIQNGDSTISAHQLGIWDDLLVPGDYDGDAKTDICVFRNGMWYWINSSTFTMSGAHWGMAGDKAVPADFTGDGRYDLAISRRGVWWILDLSNGQYRTVPFGLQDDITVQADYDGDGKADLAVFRNGQWHILRSTEGYLSLPFGLADDRPVVADYDGDGRSDIAVYRNGTWHILESTSGYRQIMWGLGSDTPTPADYDGDGKADPAVYRDGIWWISKSTGGTKIVPFGLASDIPVTGVATPY